MIATHGPPSLKEPEKWSDIFKHFLGRCLELEPGDRATATELLEVCIFYLFHTKYDIDDINHFISSILSSN